MIQIVRDALSLLASAERRRLYLLLVLSALAAIVQTLAILSAMPFIVLLANPGLLETSSVLARIYDLLGAQSYATFLVMFGVFGILMITIGNVFLAVEYWLSHRFVCLLNHRLEKEMLGHLLAQPYERHVQQHSARLSDVVLSQVERVVDGVIESFMVALSNMALTAFIVVMLLIINLTSTLVTLAALLIAYLSLFLMLRQKIEHHGAEYTRLSGNLFTHVREMLDGIREIKTRQAEKYFANRFDKSSREMSTLAVRYGILSYLPNFILETLIFTGLVGLALFFVLTTQDNGASLSYIALYGISIYRLVPALRGVFESMGDIHHNADAVRIIREHITFKEPQVPQRQIAAPKTSFGLENVSYSYGGDDAQVMGISVSIAVGSSICLFGRSGSGKTTVLNILSGLLYPQRGRVFSDTASLGPDTRDSWRALIGYCPQSVFLFDDTVASNIAFGQMPDQIDIDRVTAAAEIAKIREFVETNLEYGFETVIGEDGKTLSGGQQQRLGIARALYHDPSILLLDESFNGLDASTRDAILDELFGLRDKTLVFSSHDSKIAQRCDRVALIDKGRLIACDSFAALESQIANYTATSSPPTEIGTISR